MKRNSNKPTIGAAGIPGIHRGPKGREERRTYEKHSRERAEARMSVRGVRRSHPDPKRLALVLIQLALQEAEAELQHSKEMNQKTSGAGDEE
jgi:hypothetical protein